VLRLEPAYGGVQLAGVGAREAQDVVVLAGGVERLDDLRGAAQCSLEGRRVRAAWEVDLDQCVDGEAERDRRP
jgi:hypothetical protein